MLIYQLLVVERLAPARDVAHGLGVSYDVLQSRLNHRTRFRPAEVRQLINLLDDQRLLRFFADDTRYIIARRPTSIGDAESVRTATAAAMHEAIDIMNVVVSALEGAPKLDHRDRLAILKEVKEAETAIANLRAALEPAAA